MLINRRTFTFTSLTLVAQGIPAFASSKTETPKRPLASQWSARVEGELLYLTLTVRNLTTEALTILSHKGLRPAPELTAEYVRGAKRHQLQFAPLTEAEDNERRSRGLPKRKWITLKPKSEMELCRFRMTKPVTLASNDLIQASSTISIHEREEIQLNSAQFSTQTPSDWT